MTIPHLMNCPHTSEGWCLECVVRLGNERERLDAYAEELVAILRTVAIWENCAPDLQDRIEKALAKNSRPQMNSQNPAAVADTSKLSLPPPEGSGSAAVAGPMTLIQALGDAAMALADVVPEVADNNAYDKVVDAAKAAHAAWERARSRIAAAGKEPVGWKLVPRTMTPTMLQEFYYLDLFQGEITDNAVQYAWRCAVDAAPEQFAVGTKPDFFTCDPCCTSDHCREHGCKLSVTGTTP